MEWTVAQLAERAGVSGRTLRHYHRIGLLEPDRVGANGYRFYGADAVARLQRILLLRDTGMPLGDIAAVLDAPAMPDAEINALEEHLEQLRREQEALDRRVAAVRHTLAMRRDGREPRMDMMLDGFNDRYEAEVVARWGQEAFDVSHHWWHSKSVAQQREWMQRAETLLERWGDLHRQGHSTGSAAARSHADEHLAWFAEIPGTPAHDGDAVKAADMVIGIASQYENDPDFHAKFGGEQAARFAAEALRERVHHRLVGATPNRDGRRAHPDR